MLEADQVPETLEPILAMFFDEMWPYLKSSVDALQTHIASDRHLPGDELPRKTFTATRGFEELQTGDGPLTVPFKIGGISSRRMVVPYQIWMLQRLDAVMTNAPGGQLALWLQRFADGEQLLSLGTRLKGCAIEKRGGLLFSATA